MSSALAGLAVSYPQLLVLRGVGGVGSAVFTIASTSLLLRVAKASQRGRTQSLYRGGFLIGGIVGPALGGAVVGVSLRAPFFLYAVTLVAAGVAAATLLPRELRDADAVPDAVPTALGPGEDDAVPLAVPEAPPRTTLREALGRPAYRAALAGNFAVGFSLLGVRSVVVPLLVVQGLRIGAGWVGRGVPRRRRRADGAAPAGRPRGRRRRPAQHPRGGRTADGGLARGPGARDRSRDAAARDERVRRGRGRPRGGARRRWSATPCRARAGRRWPSGR